MHVSFDVAYHPAVQSYGRMCRWYVNIRFEEKCHVNILVIGQIDRLLEFENFRMVTLTTVKRGLVDVYLTVSRNLDIRRGLPEVLRLTQSRNIGQFSRVFLTAHCLFDGSVKSFDLCRALPDVLRLTGPSKVLTSVEPYRTFYVWQWFLY